MERENAMEKLPGNEMEMADRITQEQVSMAPEKGKQRTKVQPQQEVRDIHDRQTIEKLLNVLKELTLNKFFGELLLKYESGHIVFIKKTECIRFLAQRAG